MVQSKNTVHIEVINPKENKVTFNFTVFNKHLNFTLFYENPACL